MKNTIYTKMKTLKEALFSKKNLKIPKNPYGLTVNDLKGAVEGFPLGIVVRIIDEAKKQDESYTIERFLKWAPLGLDYIFHWQATEAGFDFWNEVIRNKNFDLFFKKYPDYERYNLS